jgi:hypothetical protein
MSEEGTSDVLSRSGRGSGLVQDYFGPGPAIGPYSETQDGTSAVTTPGLERGGVPLQPDGPGDIAVPVEIDSRLREPTDVPSDLAVTPPTGSAAVARPYSEDYGQEERFELDATEVGQISPGLPSPYTPSPPEPRPGQQQ